MDHHDGPFAFGFPMGPPGCANHTAQETEMRGERSATWRWWLLRYEGCHLLSHQGLRRNCAHGLPSPSDRRSPRHSPRRCGVENSKQLRTGGAEGISTGPPPHLAVMLPMPRTSLFSSSSVSRLVVTSLPQMLPSSSPASETRCGNSKETISAEG